MDHNKADNGKRNSSGLGIKLRVIGRKEDVIELRDIGKPRDIDRSKVVEDIKMDIITNKSRTSILFSFYLSIATLLRVIIH